MFRPQQCLNPLPATRLFTLFNVTASVEFDDTPCDGNNFTLSVGLSILSLSIGALRVSFPVENAATRTKNISGGDEEDDREEED